MVREDADASDRDFIHKLRHQQDLTPNARLKEILRHAIAHDLLRLPFAGFTAVDHRTQRPVEIPYNSEHPLEKTNGVDFIYVTDEEGVPELVIVPKKTNVQIKDVVLSYNTDAGLKDFQLDPQPFQRDPVPEPYDFSHFLYKVTRGQANVDPLFRFIRVLARNTNISALANSRQPQEREEFRRSVRQQPVYEPPAPVVRSRYVPREARAPETVVSVSSSG